MRSFPEIADLAAAEEDDVLALWSGLGYYARARNLHKATRQVVDELDGKLPADIQELQCLPGIGRSTAGAILSLANGQRQPILDGNVKRVLTRCFAVAGWPGRSHVLQQLWKIAESITPAEHTAQFNQAMMDLGATICRRSKPRCEACPLQAHCLAKKMGKQSNYPTAKPKKTLPVKSTIMLLIHDDKKRVLLYKRPVVGIWPGLWSLPEIESVDKLPDWCEQNGLVITGTPLNYIQLKHSFSHFHLQINTLLVHARISEKTLLEASERVWYKYGLKIGGMSAPVTQLLKSFWELE